MYNDESIKDNKITGISILSNIDLSLHFITKDKKQFDEYLKKDNTYIFEVTENLNDKEKTTTYIGKIKSITAIGQNEFTILISQEYNYCKSLKDINSKLIVFAKRIKIVGENNDTIYR